MQRNPFNLIEEINKNIEFRKEPGGHFHYTSSAWNEKSY